MSLLIKASIKVTGGFAVRNPFHSKQFTSYLLKSIQIHSNPHKMKSFTTAILMLSMAMVALKNGSVQAGCLESLCDPWSAAAKHAAADSDWLSEANRLAAAAFGNPDEENNAKEKAVGNGERKPTVTEPKSEVKAAKQKRGGGTKRSPKFGPSKSSQKHEATGAAAIGGDN